MFSSSCTTMTSLLFLMVSYRRFLLCIVLNGLVIVLDSVGFHTLILTGDVSVIPS